jgi:hypothetical protein
MNRDYPLSELRIVETYLKGNHIPQIHYMHKDQVDTFVEATIQLHHVVGNPHHRDEQGNPKECRLDNLWQIRVCELETETASYWWCVPDLQKNNDTKGAQLNQTNPPFRGYVWRHPDLIAQLAEEHRQEMQLEAQS